MKIKVVPGARRTEIVGSYDDGVKVRVAAPPEGGKANQALIEVLARELGVKNDAVRIVRGHASPHKVVEIDGLSPAEALARLSSQNTGPGRDLRASSQKSRRWKR